MSKKKENNSIDLVEVSFIEGEYHLTPRNLKGKMIPRGLFFAYTMARSLLADLRSEIGLVARPSRDKRMYVAKNHIEEGEVHKFEDDGSVTVKKP